MSDPNVILLNPSINLKTQKKILTDIIRVSFPMSLGHLGGYLLRNDDISLEIYDDQISRLDFEDLEKIVLTMAQPRIIGLTTMTATSARAYQLAEMVKKIDPQAIVVAGGIHATVLPEEPLSHGAIDIVVRGEGEITFDILIRKIINEQDYRDVLGITYCDNGNPVSTQSRPLIKSLDSLPPFPYHLFQKNKDKYPGFFSVQTSRGCPYACVFCSQRSMTGRTYRYLSTPRALSEITTLVEVYNADVIRIMDDNIAANKRRLLDLLDAIIASGLHKKTSFEAPMRADNMDQEIAEKLKEANFSMVSFGLETGSERLMKLINKGETVNQVVRAIELAAAKKLPAATTLIFGLPTETRSERWAGIKLVGRLPLDSVRFNILTPYPGTPIYETLVKEKKVRIKKDWENFSVQYMWAGDDLPYVPDGTDRYELMFTTMLANLLFYFRPSGVKKMLTKSFAGGNVVLLPKGWYLSSYFFKIARVGLYLVGRFLAIFFKMVVHLTASLFRPRKD